MNKGIKIGLSLYGLWFFGEVLLLLAGVDIPTLYHALPILGPFAAIALLSILIWLHERYEDFRNR